MKALTIKQPWAWAITDSTKRVENRTWKPPYGTVGQRIAIHTSATISQADMILCRQISPVPLPDTSDLLAGYIVATTILRAYIVVDGSGGVIEQTRYAENYNPHADPWFFGPVGWLLEDVIKLPNPIPCRGKLKLWDAPVELPF